MTNNSLKQNIIYQGLYQMIRILTPLITIPIISRAFGPSGVGIYSFSFNTVQYFLMFANVGVQLYFNRLIADVDSSKDEMSQRFWNIFISKGLLSLLMILLYVIVISIFVHDYYFIFLLQGIYLIGAAFDISWFYAGIEKFKLPSLSSMLTSLIVLLVVFFLINDKNDLVLYVTTLSTMTIVSQIPLFLMLKGKIKRATIQWSEIWEITKASMAYLLPNGQLNILTSIACLVLGFITSYKEVGIFANTFNILMVIIVLINTFDLVMIPRITKQSKNNKDSIIQSLEQNINIQIMLTIPMVLGIISIMPGFYWWFFGESFKSTVQLMTILSILLFIIPLNMLVSRQYMIIKGYIYAYNLSMIFGIVINLVLSIILVIFLGIYGVAIARVITELIILIWRIADISKEKIAINKINLVKNIISAIIMFITLNIINQHLPREMYITILDIVVGALVYIIINILMKNQYLIMMLKSLIKKEV
ncbi:oligosaccharide flippase family protein [Staphylococcus simiae]|uniref:oligosaccharide flippase family protein n=1 Tax=Staphylococcus simiae TaxID=308354 RepID=UPI001A98A90D|nr:oligosaccharide flippase family protein [Staphylococcus simiae]MBO1198294.1 oligosaccharide flippase family protein [Staphylococcus simiae]MBO1201971.1 oligosaccharide flippase family protein [Staphylococcus simiae]MBO1204197.1 oligosaccharide flippase family protein [Staphylococcus simiae]MBO1210286.1 oligosaccharide flippase family protein [Staphylococcus simiae]MBO1230431.1 oligosaccharide flippase family protein [Staphylococcus simiae]